MDLFNAGMGRSYAKIKRLTQRVFDVHRQRSRMLQEVVEIMEAGASEAFPVGARVRVKSSVVVYHHPDHRNQPFDIQGLEGTVAAIIRQWEGREVSANYPIYVNFLPKFSTHLQETELEVVG